MIKKILKYTGITFLMLIVLLLLTPVLFKGKIIALIKEKINENVEAKVDFKDVEISIIKSFPKLSVGLNNLSIMGVNDFANDSLISAGQLSLSMNLWKAITSSQVEIHKIEISNATVRAIVNKQGKNNWSITKPSTTTTETDKSKPLNLKLEKYSLTNCNIFYDDYMGNMYAAINNINHSGSGDFTADIFTLKTATTIENWNYKMNGITYINNATTKADIDLQVEALNKKISFNTDKITLNNLQIATNGFFQMLNEGYAMDINFKAPSTEFKNILSLIPAIYKNNFSTLKTSGSAIFNGFVKGNFNKSTIPAYQINVQVNDGFFQYPDLPTPVKDINVVMKVDNPDGITDHTIVDISKASLNIAGEPFFFKLLVKNPVSDLFVDAAAKGKLDLSKVSQFVKMPNITTLQGIVNANVEIAGSTKAMQNRQLQNVKAQGNIDISNFKFASKDNADGVSLSSMSMSFNPSNVTLSNLVGNAKNINFSANGFVNNLLSYTLKNEPLEGVLNVKADKINLNEFMGINADTSKHDASSKPFIVPNNLNLTLNAAIDNILYNTMNMSNVNGSLKVANETISMNNIKAKALSGDFAISGFYSTKLDNKKPDISFTYNVNNVDIQQTFYAFNTVQKLMPIGKYLAGKLTTSLNLTGKLGDNMMPDMNTLTGNGNLLLIEGVLSKFAPVEKIASTLNVNQLQNILLKDVKTFFEFADGKVFVKPFNIKLKDISMEIGGNHSITQILDYTINMKLPRTLMGASGNNLINNLSAQATAKGLPIKVSDIVNVQMKLGGSISSPTLKTDLKQTATSLADDVKNQVTNFVQQKIDSTKNAVNNTINQAQTAVKDTVKALKNEAINKAKDEVIKNVFGKKDSAQQNTDPKKRIEDAGKNILKDLNPFKKG